MADPESVPNYPKSVRVRLLDPFEDDNVRADVNDDAALEREDLRRELGNDRPRRSGRKLP